MILEVKLGVRLNITPEQKGLQGEPHTEKENAETEDTKEDLLRQAQAFEIEELKQKVIEITKSKKLLEEWNKKLPDYAKGLASIAAVELKAMTGVAKLMNHNKRLTAELAAPKNSPAQRKTMGPTKNGQRYSNHTRPKEQSASWSELKIREVALRRKRCLMNH